MKSPFKFLDAYTKEDNDVFFGREKETDTLYNALSGVKHLLVYGPSGAGKTSLIECGLRNQFSDADWYALSIRKGKNINESVFTEINKALRNKLPQNNTQDFTELVENLFAERYQPVYLLFDQFEELLILGEKEEKETFFQSINQLIRYKVPCRILFIMREEFIGHLSEFEPLCPTLFQNRHRVEKIRKENVQVVIQKMLDAPEYQKTFQVQESESLAQKILSKLPDSKKEIELAHVQVFLSELWDKAKEKAPQNALPLLQENLIDADDNLETILDSFLKKQLSKMEEKFPKKAPLEVLAVMISERHTKLQLSEKEIEKELKDKTLSLDKQQLTEMLNLFEQSRILRKLGSEENIKYEITHDVLASAVGQNLTEDMKLREKAKDIYKVYEEREGFFSQEDLEYMRPYQTYRAYPVELEKRIKASEVYLAKEKAAKAAKTRWQIIALSSLLGLALIALGIAGYYYFDARANQKKANEQTILAEKRLKETEQQKKIADDNVEEAKRQKVEADNQKVVAEKNAIEAEQQKTAAQKNATEAQKQTEIAQSNEKKAIDALAAQKAAEEAQGKEEVARKQAEKKNMDKNIDIIYALLRTKEKQEAKELWQKCLQIEPNNTRLIQLQKDME
ncbi:MAG: AAA family ATPase [Bacteroidia bacterium]